MAIETGKIKIRWFEVVYQADFNIVVRNQVMADDELWNKHYKVLGLTFCGKELSYVILNAYPKLWRWFIHNVMYATAGSQCETIM